jgi:hypothetical protein
MYPLHITFFTTLKIVIIYQFVGEETESRKLNSLEKYKSKLLVELGFEL